MLTKMTLFLACLSLAFQIGQFVAPRLRNFQPCRHSISREAQAMAVDLACNST